MCWGCRMNVCSAQVKRRGVGGTIWILGGHTICSRCWAEPIPSLAVHRGSPLARTDDRECEARSLARRVHVIASAASTRKRSSTRLFRGERVSSSVRHTWAAATGWQHGLPGLGLLASVGAHCCSRQRQQSRPLRGCRRWLQVQQTPARRPRMYRRPAVVVRGAWAHREARCSRPGCPASLAGHSRSLARSLVSSASGTGTCLDLSCVFLARSSPHHPPPDTPQGVSPHYAQDIKLHGPGSTRLGKNGPLRRLPLHQIEPRHARDRTHQAALDRDLSAARHPSRHPGQPVLQRALCIQLGRARCRRHHVREPGSKGPLDLSGCHG